MTHLPLLQRILTRWRLIRSRARAVVARATGVKLGVGVRIGAGCDLQLGFEHPRRGRLCLGDRCELSNQVVLHPYGGAITLGPDVHLGPGTVIYGHGGVEIGERCLIAMHCRILSSNHTVPAIGTDIRSQPDLLLPTRIGHDVWLGASVTVLGGVTIGDGCVVGAGAVVTRDLPAGSIAFGVPARVVRHRPST
jgi:acetyltransferase-like isoleucine patch superfamily enzyme